MYWDAIPLEPFELILGQLKLQDKLACSLVCQHWNRTLFSSPSLVRDIVFAIGPRWSQDLQDLVRASTRNYRRLLIVLTDGTWRVKVNELIAEVSQRWTIKSVSLIGEPVNLLDCFRWNVAMFDALTELSLEFTVESAWTKLSAQDVELKHLQKLHYLQVYVGTKYERLIVRFFVPNLKELYIVTDSLANQDVMYWEDPMIEIYNCSKLSRLELDLNSTMWVDFFKVERPSMERLVIRRAYDDYDERNWDEIFQRMSNLRDIEVFFASDAILASVNRNCMKLERFLMNGFCLHEGSFGNSMNISSLRSLHVDGLLNGSLYSNMCTLHLTNLQELVWKYVELVPTQEKLIIVAPALHEITLRACDYKRFQLVVGNTLTHADIDFTEPQVTTPNFFSSMGNLLNLSLQVTGPANQLVPEMFYLSNLRRFELTCSTERHAYTIDELFQSICTSCNLLEVFELRNEHEELLNLSYRSFAELRRLELLKKLVLHYINLHSVPDKSCLMIGKIPHMDFYGSNVSSASEQQITGLPVTSMVHESSTQRKMT
ncbi:uncharacterized protein LOC129757289 [Uranotaenia lowii]|uniref:uncharacterized protein LOC129757289 n=1 Tax=Uranotaenia lowii TaxID=190385 RepID=UPI0024783900|nr:uncharacterized protein LOC129757289 [Uranotaenia lowii]